MRTACLLGVAGGQAGGTSFRPAPVCLGAEHASASRVFFLLARPRCLTAPLPRRAALPRPVSIVLVCLAPATIGGAPIEGTRAGL